jgi:transcription antitermination factor NusA-like protein
MGYSTIVSILIKDEEYPLSSITVRVFQQQTGWVLGDMGENRAKITQMA